MYYIGVFHFSRFNEDTMISRRNFFLAALALVVLLFSSAFARQLRPNMLASRLAESEITSPDDLARITTAGGIIDSRDGKLARVYLLPEDFDALRAQGLALRWIPDLQTEYMQNLWAITGGADNPLADYHTNDEIQAEFAALQAAYPSFFHYESIGLSVQGRNLWVAKVSDNVNADEPEIEVKYISTMHGNEPVGTENCMRFINELLTQYGTDPELTELMDDYEMWFLPLMNPDGNAAGQRWNANGVDLNRDFPDRIQDSVNTTAGRQIETAEVMNWSAQHNFVLSANFHTGSIVTNYPWDGNASGQYIYTASPEDALFIHISIRYSQYNSPMYNNPAFPPYGITNGADWYVIYGGMQDWNYVWMGDREVTIELSNQQPPDTSQLETLWQQNRLSMRYYWLEAKYGARGVVTDSITGDPLRAGVQLNAIPYLTYSSALHGEYFRMLQNGTYNLTFSAPGYVSKTFSNVVVANNVPTVLNVPLVRAPSAQIDVDPDSLSAAIDACDSVDVPLTIQNVGTLPLTWSSIEASANQTHFGGAVGAGWRWIDGDQLGGPVYQWRDISGVGQALTFASDDQNLGPYNIGFTFPFYGQNFTTLRVAANGWISFTSTATGTSSYSNQFLPNNGTAPENLLAVWWDDLSPQRVGTSVRLWSNNSDSLIVSFVNVQSYSGGGVYNFECILESSGKITYQYASMGTARLNSATIGLQNSDRTRGTTVIYNQLYIHDNLAVSFCPNSMIVLIPSSGSIPAQNSQAVIARLKSCCLPDSVSSGILNISSNDPANPIWAYQVTLAVGAVPPDAVSNLTAEPDGDDIHLHWSAAANATSYRIYRSAAYPVNIDPGNLIATVAATEYLDVSPPVTAFYVVVSIR
jgi:carboxypeptidase D